MFQRDPVRSLACALRQALEHDLLAVGAAADGAGARRPREHECDVVLFGQVWPGAALGRRADEGRRHFERDTTVIVGPAQDACVYVGTRLLYHVRHPNRLFFQDVSAHCMAARADAAAYEGRDDATTEAVDIEVGAMLARLHVQVTAGEPQRAPLVARFLHRCAARFERPARRVEQDACAWVGGERRGRSRAAVRLPPGA